MTADIVLEPAEREAARAHEPPVEVRVGERAGIEDEAGAGLRKLGDDARGGDAEHGAGARHVDALVRFKDARAEHRLHRVARARENRNAGGKSGAYRNFLAETAHLVPGLQDAGHVLFVDPEELELFGRPPLRLNVVAEAPARHGAPVDEGILALQARETHEDVGGVVHELNAALAEFGRISEEPAREHGREHRRGFSVAGFAAPDRKLLRVEGFHILRRAAVEVVDVGRDRARIFVDADDAADDAVAHDGGDVLRIAADAAKLARYFGHGRDAVLEVRVHVHLDPAGMRIAEFSRKRPARNELEILIVDAYLHALRAGIKTHVKLRH